MYCPWPSATSCSDATNRYDHHRSSPAVSGAVLLLLADGRLPSGGHVHSGGLEEAVAAGRVRTAEDLAAYLRGRLATIGRVDAALAVAAWNADSRPVTARRRGGRSLPFPSRAPRQPAAGPGSGARRPAHVADTGPRRPGRPVSRRSHVAGGGGRRRRRLPGWHAPAVALVAAHGAVTGRPGPPPACSASTRSPWPRCLADLAAEIDATAAAACRLAAAGASLASLPADSGPLLDIGAEHHAGLGGAAVCLMITHARHGPLAGSRAPCGCDRPLRVGIGGPVGSGKTALVAALCRALADRHSVAVVTNDIYTTEDARLLRREAVLDDDRIVAVETGCCPHTAIRDDISANLDAIEALEARFADLDAVLLESGGDNLTATFSYGLVDVQIFVIDVAGGDKVPRKGGPGITASDLLVVNKTDLAPLVRRRPRGRCGATPPTGRHGRPVVFLSVRADPKAAPVAQWIGRQLSCGREPG